MSFYRKTITLGLGAFLLCAPQVAQADKTNLKIGFSQYPSTLHPYFDSMVAKSYVLGTVLRPITVYNAAWVAECMLCTELPSFENKRAIKETRKDGGKGIAATYTLKGDLFWGDGVPVTTKDIIFSWEVGKHPQSGASNAEFFASDIVDITVKDDKTFTVHFDKELCEFAGMGDFYPLPAHIERAVFEKDPASYINRTLYNTAPTTAGLYMGPYKINRVQSGSAITIGKNPQWKGKAPSFETIHFRTIENSSALSANLLAKDIDYIAGELGLLLDQSVAFEKRLKRKRTGQFNVIYKPGLTYEHIDLPHDKAPFNDLRLRQAMMYSMNRQAISDALFDGRQTKAISNINPLDSIFTKNVQTYSYDPKVAAKLLDDAGWMKKDDGYRYNDKGEKLTITLTTTSGNKTRETVQQALQSDWKKAGINIVIDNQPARVLFGETIRKRSFKGGIMYAWMSSPKNIPKSTLHTDMIPAESNSYAGQNYPGYTNIKMDKIIDDLETVCAPKANTQLWHDLQKLYAEDLPALPLYYRTDSFFIPTWLSGIIPTGHLHPTTLWVENWNVTR